MLITRTLTLSLLLAVMMLMEQCTDMLPTIPPTNPTTAAEYLQTAIAAAQRGDYAAASEAAQQVRHLQPDLLLAPAARLALFGKVNLSPNILGDDITPTLQQVDIDYKWSSFSRRTAKLVLTRSADGKQYSGTLQTDDTSSQLDLPAAEVIALHNALSEMVPTTKHYWLTLHTDDYPYWIIKLTYSDGTEIVADSNSNVSAYVPWNFTYQGKHMVQYSTAFPTALEHIVGGRIPYLGGFGKSFDMIDPNSADWFTEDWKN